jgi:hypothetical protein
MSDLDVLIPDIGSIELSTGIVLDFHKFKWKQTKEVLVLLQKYFGVVTNPSDENIRILAAGFGEAFAKDIEILVAIVTGKTPEEIQGILDDLYVDEVISVFMRTVEVNINFFKEQFTPILQKPVEEKTGELSSPV